MGDTAARWVDDQAIENEQIRVLYSHYPVMLLVNVLLALAVVFVNRQSVDTRWLDLWTVLMLVVLTARLASYLSFRRQPSISPGAAWRRLFVLGTSATGVLWGLCAAYTYTVSGLEQRFFILFVLMGLGAGAFTSLTAYMPAFYAFLCPAILPLSGLLLLQPEPMEMALGGISLTYVIGLGFFGGNLNRALVESLSLRNHNLHLVSELSLKKEQAEQANLDKTRFLAAASHDLRQPLHALSLFIGSLRGTNRQPRLDAIIRDTEASARNLQDLFDRLLDISRLDSGALQPEVEDFILQDLLDRLARDCLPMAEDKGLRFETTACSALVRSDPILLEQILRNLLTNAIRYTESGTVHLRATQDGDGILITVADTGLGIPASRQREVFREFTRLGDRAQDRSEGLGLGLAIVDRLVTLLGHQLTLESRPGDGSRFSLRVPRGDPARIHPRAPRPHAMAGDLSTMRVLVIDDDQTILRATSALLGGWGCAVETAHTCEEALERLDRPRPDVIVADYRLPGGLTGVTVSQRLRARYARPLPALIITGDTDPEILRQVRESGFQLLHKPVKPARLRAFLRSAGRRS